MGRAIAANGLTFLIIGLVVVLGLVELGQERFYGPGPLEEAKIVEVPRGASLDRIADALATAGVIDNKSIFRIGLRYTGRDDQLKFGVYEFPPQASMDQVASLIAEGAGAAARYRVTYLVRPAGVQVRFRDLLNREAVADDDQDAVVARVAAAIEDGASIDFRVTVAEGLTSFEIVEGLKQVPYLSGDLEDVPPEGSLAPDTFAFRRGQDVTEVLSQMARAQSRIVAEVWANRQPNLPLTSPEEMLVLASIVEKEAGGPGEWERVASVFVNRLNRGMRLQADATVAYGVTEGRARRGFGLTRSELNQRTPWNTYQIDGLPPTPIGNPGRRAIEATVSPETSNFLYFVADGTGGHAFAETLAEHERNVAAWRRIEAERNANQ